MTADKARELLKRAGLFYYGDDPEDQPDPEEYPTEAKRKAIAQTLNQNDTWRWALAFGQEVTDEQLPEVGRLFVAYGYCGVLYWVSEQNKDEAGRPLRSEFEDINRFVDFVRNEEWISNERKDCAYYKFVYTLGNRGRE